MRNYDYEKAIELVSKEMKMIEVAKLGMHEDWFWTAQSVFENGEFALDLKEKPLICGIKGSRWATPVLAIEYKDGTSKFVNCFEGDRDSERPAAFEMGFGVLSDPCQDQIGAIED